MKLYLSFAIVTGLLGAILAFAILVSQSSGASIVRIAFSTGCFDDEVVGVTPIRERVRDTLLTSGMEECPSNDIERIQSVYNISAKCELFCDNGGLVASVERVGRAIEVVIYADGKATYNVRRGQELIGQIEILSKGYLRDIDSLSTDRTARIHED